MSTQAISNPSLTTNTPKDSLDVDHFPKELVQLILSFLPVQYYPNASCTCKFWNQEIKRLEEPKKQCLRAFLISMGYKHTDAQELRQPNELQIKKTNIIPDCLYLLRNLETLIITNNELTRLPDSLVFCRKLQTIDLQNNKFTIFPTVLLQIKTLKKVNLRRNNLQWKPADVHFELETDPNIKKNEYKN